ncbi:hypothetical protein PV518_48360 [Streptomyces sp. ND04-05B]|nr:hypothetical protein [Streptomyces sp. ND04-05B]MDX3069847.1 hypothetical protein [Streptomyces sp. ND04-05B]
MTSAQVKEKRTTSTASTRAHSTAPLSTRCAPPTEWMRTGWMAVRIVVRT